MTSCLLHFPNYLIVMLLKGSVEGPLRAPLFPSPLSVSLLPFAFVLFRSLTVFCLIALCCFLVSVLLRYTLNSIVCSSYSRYSLCIYSLLPPSLSRPPKTVQRDSLGPSSSPPHTSLPSSHRPRRRFLRCGSWAFKLAVNSSSTKCVLSLLTTALFSYFINSSSSFSFTSPNISSL